MTELFECVFGKLHRMDYANAKLFAFSLLRTPILAVPGELFTGTKQTDMAQVLML